MSQIRGSSGLTSQRSNSGGYNGGAGGLWGGSGGGFLPTDPRGPGNRGHQDTSVLQTGNFGDSIGFASPQAQPGYGSMGKPARHNPYYDPLTQAEQKQRKLDQGIAPTHDNMGGLATQYRADADAAHARGEQSTEDKHAARVVAYREVDARNRSFGGSPRAKAKNAVLKANYDKGWLNSSTRKPSGGASGTVSSMLGPSGAGMRRGMRTGTRTASSGGSVASSLGSGSRSASGGYTGNITRPNTSSGDISGLAAQRSHASMPYTQTLGGRR